MAVRRVEIERISVESSKPFDLIITTLEAAVGHPDMTEFVRNTNSARSFEELEGVVRRFGQNGTDDFHEA